MSPDTPERVRLGRPPSASAEEIERSSLALLVERGYHEVSVAELAAAAGISRATFFRYFPTKADLVWQGFDRSLDALEQALQQGLERGPAELATMPAIRDAISESVLASATDHNTWWEGFLQLSAQGALGGESHDRWARWSGLVAHFVAARMGVSDDHPVPIAIAWAYLGIYLSTLQAWAGRPMDCDLLLDELLGSIDLVAQQMAGLLTLAD